MRMPRFPGGHATGSALGLAARRPAGWLRWRFKAPVPLYRLRLGMLFGHRILVVVHHGRCSGVRRRTALEVAGYDPATHQVTVISGWSARADGTATSALEVRIGRKRYRPPQVAVVPR